MMQEPPKPPNDDAQKPVTPVDMMLAKFEIWLEKMEKLEAEQRERSRIPDDIPRFITGKP